ncbi:CHY zinc finger protein [Bacillus spongiae]|uniref:CHY zinc finger protein n=1 Tax=Bacillus spongiae TaxID=2683610 RepID=A0ABU8HG16_9BACI
MKQDYVIQGVQMDHQTRCKHYAKNVDIIAIKFKCCQTYYPCYQCHQELTDHLPIIWSKAEQNEKAILCGNCKQELTIEQYKKCQSRCPLCLASFNPGCENHSHLYFE